jgi:DNA-directed RNA polymerase sigma subunit (sigma70/sigma32)
VNDPEDTLPGYLEAIEQLPRLSEEEQMGLGRAVRAGGPDAESAEKKLMETSLHMVPLIARRYLDQGLGVADLIQEGNLGLARAVSLYDGERPFPPLATKHIEEAIAGASRGR